MGSGKSRLAALMMTLAVAGCTEATLSQSQDVLGDFRLGHNVAIADNVQAGPFSRELVESEIEVAMQTALEDRLGAYDGDGLYHIGVYIGAAVLAQPGVPLIYTPQSAMVFEVNVFDNATRERLNAEPHRITVGEGIENTAPIVGSGLTRDRAAQIENLTTSAAREIEEWLRENDSWFTPKPGQVRVPFGDDEELPEGAEEAIRPSDA